jgi:hypothetical protein
MPKKKEIEFIQKKYIDKDAKLKSIQTETKLFSDKDLVNLIWKHEREKHDLVKNIAYFFRLKRQMLNILRTWNIFHSQIRRH